MRLKFGFLIFLLVDLLSESAQASHLMGGDIGWKCVGRDSFIITVVKYRDCNGATMTPATVVFKNSETGVTITYLNLLASAPVDVTPGFANHINYCTSPNAVKNDRCTNPLSTFPFGVEKYIYQGLIVFSLTGNECKITISHRDFDRNSTITSGAANQPLYIEAKLNRCLNPCDNSPEFTSEGVAIVCIGQPFIYNPGAVDSNYQNGNLNDSLTYEFTPPLSDAGTPTSWINGYSYDKPVRFQGYTLPNWRTLNWPLGLHFDNQTGDLMYTPVSIEQTIIAIKVKEYRNGELIGEITRDMQIIAAICPSNSPPVLYGPFFKQVCAGDVVSFDNIATFDPNANDTLWITWNKGISGAVWSDNNCLVKHPRGILTWHTKETDASTIPYSFTVTVKDNASPIPSFCTRAYQVLVSPKPTASAEVKDTCANYYFRAFSPLKNASFMWLIDDKTFLGPGVIKKSLLPGKHIYSLLVTASIGNLQCTKTYKDSVFVDSFLYCDIGNDTDLCKGSLITLRALYGYNKNPVSFKWSTSVNDTFQTKTLAVINDTTISLKITDHRCDFTDDIQLIKHDFPQISLEKSKRICYNDVAVIRPVFSFDRATLKSVDWLDEYNRKVSGNCNLTTMDTGAFICVVTDNIGCANSETVEIHKNPPVHAIASDTSVCLGDTAFLRALKTGGGAEKYRWYCNRILIDSTSLIKILPLQNTELQLFVTETNEGVTCSDQDTVNIVVKNKPGISIKPVPPACPDANAIDLNKYIDYPKGGKWMDEKNTIVNDSLFVPLLADSGLNSIIYKFTDNNSGCTNFDTTEIFIYNKENSYVIKDDTICSSSGLYLLTSDSIGSWSGEGVIKIHGKWYFDYNMVGNYEGKKFSLIYEKTDKNKCKIDDTLHLTVFTTPTIRFHDPINVCANSNPVNLADENYPGSWSGTGVKENVFYPDIAGPGIHHIKYEENNHGCLANNDVIVQVYDKPVIFLGTSNGDTVFCSNAGLIRLKACCKPTGGHGTWTGNGITNDSFFNTLLFMNDLPEYHDLQYTVDDTNGCLYTNSLKLKTIPFPRINIIRDTFCNRDTFTVRAMNLYSNGICWHKSYTSDGFFISDSTRNTVKYVAGNNDKIKGSFLLFVQTIQNNRICGNAYDTVLINIPEDIQLNIKPDKLQGCVPFKVKFDYILSDSLIHVDRYQWDFGNGKISDEKNPIQTYFLPGKYKIALSLLKNGKCKIQNDQPCVIIASPTPHVYFEPEPQIASISSSTISFKNLSQNITSNTKYYWFFDELSSLHLPISYDFEPSHKFSDTGVFNVKLIVSTENHCVDSFIRNVYITADVLIFIPNAFTPDDKGPELNNIFRVSAFGIIDFHLEIFSRWGELLYQSNDYETHGWNGTYLNRNIKVPVGEYVYILNVNGKCGKNYKFHGTISLLR